MSYLLLPEYPTEGFAKGEALGFVTDLGALYIGTSLDTSVHSLHCYKVYIAIRGEFHLFLAGVEKCIPCKAVIVPPDLSHRVESCGAVIGVFYLIPETVEGRRVADSMYGKHPAHLPGNLQVIFGTRLGDYLNHGCYVDEAGELTRQFVCRLTSSVQTKSYDARVMLALEHLNSALCDGVSIAELASAVALSPSRLEHLFRSQVGIPISRYLLWARVRESVRLMAKNMSLTTVAHNAGFYDSAHFSRTFRRMVGLSPSTVLRSTNLFVEDDGSATRPAPLAVAASVLHRRD